MTQYGFPLIPPRVSPVLHSHFRPAVLADHAFCAAVQATGKAQPVRLALQQADGSVFQHLTAIFPDDRAEAADNFTYLERLVKFLLWAWGGWRIHFDGPPALAAELQRHFRETPT